jgi:hypothetical protein
MLTENEGHVRCKRWLADEVVVIGVRANPEPNEVLTRFDCECAMLKPDARRPESAHLLEMQRGVTGVPLQMFVRTICCALNVGRKRTVKPPESGRGPVLQMGFVLPAACSRNASSASESSLPA